MNFQTTISAQNKLHYLLIILISITGCSTIADKKNAAFEPQDVKNMVFKFDNSSDFLGVELPEQTINTKVSANLNEWGYTFNTDTSTDYSHDLAITIDSIKHGSTPVGFSFSSGNSDPRALDFQKANVLPFTCSLMPKENHELQAELTMEVTADEYLRFAKLPSPHNRLVEELINDMSTTCFNLLSSLKIKTKQQPEGSTRSKKSGWIPEIRVEIENETEPAAEQKKATQQTNDVKKPKTQPRKKIIIHNQGSPVIFKFGHERK